MSRRGPGSTAGTAERIAKNLVALGIGSFISRVLGLGTLAILARLAGPTEFGRYAIAVSFASMFAVCADLGLGTVLIRDLSRDFKRASTYLSTLALAKFALLLGMLALVWTAAAWFQYPEAVKHLIFLAALGVGFMSLSILWVSVFRAWERMEYESLLVVLQSAVVLGLTFWVLRSGYGVAGVLMGRIAATAGIMVIAFIWILRTQSLAFRPRPRILGPLLREALPFALFTGLGQLWWRLNVVMLSATQSTVSVAWYQAAHVLVETPLITFSLLFNRALFPVFSRMHTNHAELRTVCQGTLKALWLLGFPFVTGLVIWSGELIRLLYGTAYAHAAPILSVLAWTLVCSFPTMVWSTLLGATGAQRSNVVLIAGALGLQAILNLIWIPAYGPAGAAWAAVWASGCLTVASFIRVCRRVGWFVPMRGWPRVAAVSVLFWWMMSILPLRIWSVPVAAIGYVGLLLLCRACAPEEWQLLRQLWGQFRKAKIGVV